jgi:DNA-binding MarR family transcriptional regulator
VVEAGTDGRSHRRADVHLSAIVAASAELVGRLEADSLLTREQDAADKRGKVVVLTGGGRSKLEAARASHLASVRRHVLAHAAPKDLELLGEFWRRVLGSDA